MGTAIANRSRAGVVLAGVVGLAIAGIVAMLPGTAERPIPDQGHQPVTAPKTEPGVNVPPAEGEPQNLIKIVAFTEGTDRPPVGIRWILGDKTDTEQQDQFLHYEREAALRPGAMVSITVSVLEGPALVSCYVYRNGNIIGRHERVPTCNVNTGA